MQVSKCVGCKRFQCADVDKAAYVVPSVELEPQRVSMLMISEAAPSNPRDYYYAGGSPSFEKTTVQAFKDAGADVTCMRDLLERGVYLTTAVKCGKTDYAIESNTIKQCSYVLEKELALFPNVKACLLMGDVAIKAFNYVALRASGKRVIPAGSTYKIRGQKYLYNQSRVFPSYLQVGPSFNIEKSKRRMIAEDIAAALRLARARA